MEFNVGDKVINKSARADNIVVGTVKAVYPDYNEIDVEWEITGEYGHKWVDRNLNAGRHAPASEKKTIEENYKRVADEVRTHILAAAAALKAATAAAGTAYNYDTESGGLRDFYSETAPLLAALAEAGWNSSSMQC